MDVLDTIKEHEKEVKTAMELWIDAAKKEGREIPKPMGKELLKSVIKE
ncbi:MAG: hypothetical protein R6U44_00930 [Archaeoglobaceae archaeon]